MTFNKIRFDDTLQVDTKLAEEYLQKEQKTFHSKGYEDKGSHRFDACKNMIFIADYTKHSGSMVLVHDIREIPKKLFHLAKKIEEHIDLFCQLDYLMRKVPMHENKSVDLQLLIQNLLLCSKPKTKDRQTYPAFMWHILMSAATPLAALGCLGQALMSKLPHVIIESTVETAAVCSLFTDLCYQVGLRDKVRLAIVEEVQLYGSAKVDLNTIPVLKSGCVGIVATKSDVESAVDTFLAATDRYPWHIRKILVQEGALERFKNTLEWKTNSEQNALKKNTTEHLQALSTSLYNYEAKTFLFEFSGTELDDSSGNVILIDSYRTTKELLYLLKDTNHYAASLWCSDVAESNEIAFNINPHIIWINDFCNFNGPPKSSRAFYSIIDAYYSTTNIEEIPEVDQVMELRKLWLELGYSKRESIVRDILKTVPLMKGFKTRETIDEIDFGLDSFLSVENSTVCYGTELTPVVMELINDVDIATISYIVKGGGLIVFDKRGHLDKEFTARVIEALIERGAPIVCPNKRVRYGRVRISSRPLYGTKVVWSRFCTIFAN